MNKQLKDIIDRLEMYIQKSHLSGNKYDFIDPAFDIRDELEVMPDNFCAVKPILELIERSPEIEYGGPGPLGSFLEKFYRKGYEQAVVESIKRKPTEFTLFLLHRMINDLNHPDHNTYIQLMKDISTNVGYSDNIRGGATRSLSYYQ